MNYNQIQSTQQDRPLQYDQIGNTGGNQQLTHSYVTGGSQHINSGYESRRSVRNGAIGGGQQVTVVESRRSVNPVGVNGQQVQSQRGLVQTQYVGQPVEVRRSHYVGGSQYATNYNDVRVSNVREGQAVVIGENVHPSRIVGTQHYQGQVVDVVYGQSREVGRNVTYVGEERVRETRLAEREQRTSVVRKNVGKDIMVNAERAIINERIVEKPIEVVVEKPVPRYVEVDVPYDVIVERPIQKIIERDVVTEIIMEKTVDKIIEVPVEKIVEVNIERVIEKPVYVELIREVPREVVVARKVEQIVERPVYSTTWSRSTSATFTSTPTPRCCRPKCRSSSRRCAAPTARRSRT